MLLEKGRIALDRDAREWMRAALALDRCELLPLTPSVAATAYRLGGTFHGDSADRLIVASAVNEAATLVTKDERIRAFQGVESLW